MKPGGPGGTSTPSMVPHLKGRQPVSKNPAMPSPIHLYNGNEKKTKESDNLTDESDEEINVNSSHTDVSSTQDQISEDENSEDEDDIRNISRDYVKQYEYKEKQEEEKYIVQRKNVKRMTFESATMTTAPKISVQTQKIGSKQHGGLNTKHFCICILSIVVLLVVGAFPYMHTKEPVNIIEIDQIKELFPQNNMFWISIKSGVSEIIHFNKPSVIVIAHKNDVHSITELLGNITMYASCILNENCNVEPIIINGNDLNTHEMRQDYGIIVDHFRPLLEEKHIMVVKNMDEISGSVAQAFHSICDEFSPLVKRSLIIFTIKVDEYIGKPLKQVVDILNEKWSDIEPDKLEPLITRVSSIVLRVK
ncbi:hypothetical protein Trydic_g6162 [Trypoxylus dichotomus]